MDYQLFKAINGLAGRNAIADAVMKAFATWGPEISLLVAALIWFLPGRLTTRGLERRVVIYALLTAAIGLGLNQVISHAWARPRPSAAHAVTLLLGGSSDPSFPSDHATLVIGLALPVLIYLRRWGVLLLVMAALISFARIYVGRHYPGDILGSAAVAFAATMLVWSLRGRLEWLIAPILKLLVPLRLADRSDVPLPPALLR
ncbi:MAG: phosphoesterase PA-phosphatase related protein [Chloroflexi bacterium]|jgi:undecaprenyl-diphosphatase|nr:phosphoesterase PA-phosphatase related protein [Chloroflexota bacterium]